MLKTTADLTKVTMNGKKIVATIELPKNIKAADLAAMQQLLGKEVIFSIVDPQMDFDEVDDEVYEGPRVTYSIADSGVVEEVKAGGQVDIFEAAAEQEEEAEHDGSEEEDELTDEQQDAGDQEQTGEDDDKPQPADEDPDDLPY